MIKIIFALGLIAFALGFMKGNTEIAGFWGGMSTGLASLMAAGFFAAVVAIGVAIFL